MGLCSKRITKKAFNKVQKCSRDHCADQSGFEIFDYARGGSHFRSKGKRGASIAIERVPSPNARCVSIEIRVQRHREYVLTEAVIQTILAVTLAGESTATSTNNAAG